MATQAGAGQRLRWPGWRVGLAVPAGACCPLTAGIRGREGVSWLCGERSRLAKGAVGSGDEV